MTSFGSSTFTSEMADALDGVTLRANELNDDDYEYENDLLEDALATDAVPPALQHMMSVPAATQDADADADADDHVDDFDRDTLNAKYSTLTAKTQQILRLINEQSSTMMSFEVIGTPFEILGNKHDEIAAMPHSEDKLACIKMYNAISVLFSTCRHNPAIREFMSILFKQTEDYYTLKRRRKQMNAELQTLIQLRDEQEMENFRAKQKKRLEQEMQDGESKAKKARKYVSTVALHCSQLTCLRVAGHRATTEGRSAKPRSFYRVDVRIRRLCG